MVSDRLSAVLPHHEVVRLVGITGGGHDVCLWVHPGAGDLGGFLFTCDKLLPPATKKKLVRHG